jgi:hypothetical protein
VVTVRRLLVTGSRTWHNAAMLEAELAEWFDPDTVLVHGACPQGADMIADQAWHEWGGKIERHPAQWDVYGKRAGFLRNEEMVRQGADACLAFIRDASKGATHTANLAIGAGIPTVITTWVTIGGRNVYRRREHMRYTGSEHEG